MNETTGDRVCVAIGEILWDVFPSGPRFGGAPANFACHLAALGGKAVLVGAVGNDQLGARAFKLLSARGVRTEHIYLDWTRPTGIVDVSVDDEGHASYSFADNTAWDAIPWTNSLANRARQSDLCCFGTLAQRSETSAHTIRKFLAATPEDSIRLLDVNLRPPFFNEELILESLGTANALKLNDGEFAHLAKLCALEGAGEGDPSALRRLAGEFDLQFIALTKGAHGSVLIDGDEVSCLDGTETPPVEIVDTVGAGDSFTAAVALGFLDRIANPALSLESIHLRAARIASYVCTQSGATPQIPQTYSDY